MGSDFKDVIFHGLIIFEVLINLTTYPIGALSYYLINKHSVFHANLTRQIKVLIIYFLFTQIMRLVVAINEGISGHIVVLSNVSINYMIISGTNEFTVFGLFRLAGIMAVYATLGTIIFERIWATVYLENYEKTISNIFFISCIAYHAICYITITFCIYKEWMDLTICGTFVILMNLIGYFILTFLECFNKRRYHNSFMFTKKYTLSERYQLQENIKTAFLMKRVGIVIVLFNILVGLSMTVSNFFYISEFAKRLAYVTFNYAISFYGYTFPLLGMGNNPLWHQIFQRIKKWTRIAPTSLPELQSQQEHRAQLCKQIRGFDGAKIIFTIDEEREVYFNNLKNHWNK